MADVWVADQGLEGLAAKARDVADGVVRSQGTVRGATGNDTAAVTHTHRALVDRWVGGLVSAEAAVTELADSIAACEAGYRATDSDQGVTFEGLAR